MENLKDIFARYDIGTVIRMLKQDGQTIIGTIKIVVQHTNLDLAEAKRTVHESDAWKSERPVHDAFHERVAELIDQLDKDPNKHG